MCHRSSSSVILINYSCVHNQIATFGLFSRQSVTLDIGLNIGCSHHRDNRPSEQSAKCTIGQALLAVHFARRKSGLFTRTVFAMLPLRKAWQMMTGK